MMIIILFLIILAFFGLLNKWLEEDAYHDDYEF